MNLTLVIPTHNRHRDLALLVESIFRQNPGKLQIEIIIVSNLKDNYLKAWVADLEKRSPFPIQYLEAEVIGVNSARNLGIKNARSEKIYFLDDDVLLTNLNQLINIFEMAEKNPTIAAIGGAYTIPAKSSLIDQIYHNICLSWLNNENYLNINLVGGNTLYNARVLKDQLYFNEGIIFGGTETELNLRLIKDSHKFIFTENLNVMHSTHLSLFSLIKKSIRQGMGRSFHEKIIAPSHWKVDTNKADHFNNRNIWNLVCVSWYFSFYEFFFHVGYRHGKRQNNGPLSIAALIICTFETFFQVNSDKILFLPNPSARPFHKKRYPALKFKEIFHWYKANVTWRILYFTGSVIACAIGSFIPFSTTGILTMYYHTKNNLRN